MTYWTVPPMWDGRTVAILASGPSMSQAVADAVRALPRIAINTTYRLAPDADIVYGCDPAWWNAHPEAAACSGVKLALEHAPGKTMTTPEGVRFLRNTGRRGFDPSPACIRTGDNSGAQALQVAVHAHAARVLLLGFDMQGGHWHGAHPAGLVQSGPAHYRKFVAGFRVLAAELARLPVEILNCTPGSALDCFPRARLTDVVGAA